MNKEPHRVTITCRGADADVLAEVLVDARQRWAVSRPSEMTEVERERVRSAVGVIDDVLLQLQSPASSPGRANQPVVLVIRNPDCENEFVVDGDVETIDLDLRPQVRWAQGVRLPRRGRAS